MARRTRKKPTPATENKDAKQPPEDKDDEPAQDDEQQPDEGQQDEEQQVPQDDDEQDEDSLLAEYVVIEDQLTRLLKAEGRYWTGEIGRMQMHQIAERIRKERAGEVEEGTDDE